MLVSIVIRTLNEARYLGELLEGIASQETQGLDVETVLIDSGSTDDTLAIAEKHGCVITHITREEFSFGRSLNLGCEAAQGEVLILISGHCVPRDRHRSEEHTSELQSLMRISYAVFCLKKKIKNGEDKCGVQRDRHN